MVKFTLLNKNPKGRKTGDCSTRALCNILNITYEEALKEQYEMACKYYYSIASRQTIEKVLKKYGWEKQKQPRKWDNTKYKVNEIDELLTTKQMKQGVFIIIANHCTIVRNNQIEDLWDCGRKSIGNYWIKID